MNKRIKDLLAQCIDNQMVLTHQVDLDKFAELIIKECGEVAAFGDPQYTAQFNIHRHFGVK